jgi:hypothetical protein
MPAPSKSISLRLPPRLSPRLSPRPVGRHLRDNALGKELGGFTRVVTVIGAVVLSLLLIVMLTR